MKLWPAKIHWIISEIYRFLSVGSSADTSEATAASSRTEDFKVALSNQARWWGRSRVIKPMNIFAFSSCHDEQLPISKRWVHYDIPDRRANSPWSGFCPWLLQVPVPSNCPGSPRMYTNLLHFNFLVNFGRFCRRLGISRFARSSPQVQEIFTSKGYCIFFFLSLFHSLLLLFLSFPHIPPS